MSGTSCLRLDPPEQTFGTLKQAGTPKLALTLIQLVWAVLLAILGGRRVGSSSVGDVILGAFQLCAMAGVALHGILWLRTMLLCRRLASRSSAPFGEERLQEIS